MVDEIVCQRCKSAVATVTVTKKTAQGEQELQLCEQCAQKFNNLHSLSSSTEFFENVMENIFGPDTDESRNLECPDCKLTLKEFENLGLLGCARCYEIFKDELEGLLRRIHGSNKHIGSRPRPERVIGNVPDLDALRKELMAAIEQENYESAAEYRDMIRDLERELHRSDELELRTYEKRD